jgi:hypothetical protein
VKEQDWQDGAQQVSQLFLHPASPPQLFLAPRGHSLFTYSPVKYTVYIFKKYIVLKDGTSRQLKQLTTTPAVSPPTSSGETQPHITTKSN